ncbi:unnamed protein product [Menidia menidia]|uniref:(Atlantic silverside) hypothetical protein n=1 Tax=Menidia menidia TaxID=238744 RepID=A0A8S4ANF4_9TELE|nr:unnamed protein product [Menidia menidia]
MGMIQLQNPNHPTALLHKANQMRLAGTLCDVVIMVDSQEFHAHRTVLACTSKMFEILFHRSSQHYTLDFLSPKTFQQILEYAYTATLQAKVEDLDDLLYAAEILEIEYLEEQCLKILETIQSSDENDAEANANDGSTEEDEDRKGQNGAKHSKKHSMESSSLSGTHHVSNMSGVVEQSPSVSTSYGVSNLSPTKAAVDSLMSIGQTLLQQGFGGEHLVHGNSHHLMGDIKTEMMQVDMGGNGHDSPQNMESGTSSNGERSGEDRNRDGPGTPTRSSVITSARELHYVRDDGMGDQQADVSQMGLEAMAGMTEKHLASLYSLPVNHKSDAMMSIPVSMASALPMSPALAMSMDFSAYGGLLPQSFIQREFFNKLGELAVGMKPDGRNQHERCNVCGAELPDNDAVEQHRWGWGLELWEFGNNHPYINLRTRTHSCSLLFTHIPLSSSSSSSARSSISSPIVATGDGGRSNTPGPRYNTSPNCCRESDNLQYGGRACTSAGRSVDMVQLSHGLEVLTPTFVGHTHSPLPSKDRSPLSRALNPPQSAPLHHINSGTGTNCPTLDVLETQIASAASAPQTP